MTDLFSRSVERLAGAAYTPDKPDETPETTARALWWVAAGAPRAVTREAGELPSLPPEALARLDALVARRLAGEPLAYLTGRQEFLGREFLTGPGALIPRRETEILGSAAASLGREAAAAQGKIRMLDLCTGSGNLAVSLALEVPSATVIGTDLESGALSLAQRNAQFHGVEHRMRFLQGDLFGALAPIPAPEARFSLVVCNPPYIPTQKARNMPMEVGGYEPAAAFDGGDFGLSILFRLIAEAPQYLAPGGWLCFELGAGQGPLIERRLSSRTAYSEVRMITDHPGTVRAAMARVHGVRE